MYTDGGDESNSLYMYLNTNGIEHLVSPPHTPQRLVISERRHRHIGETTKKLLHEASLSSIFLSLACNMQLILVIDYPDNY